MSYYEFQIRSELLLGILRTRRTMSPILVPGVFPTAGGPMVVVDSVEILEGAALQDGPSATIMVVDPDTPAEDSVPCKLWRVIQPVRIRLRDVDTGTLQAARDIDVPVQLTAGRNSSGAPVLSESVVKPDLDLGVFEELNPQLADALRDGLGELGATGTIPVSPLEALAGESLTFVNVGLAVSGDLQVVALRAEFTLHGLGRRPLWAGFCQGMFNKHLGGRDWGVFYPKVLLEELLRRLMGDPTGAIPDYDATLASGPTPSWQWAIENPTVGQHFTLDIENFCILGVPPIFFSVDAEMHAAVSAAFSVAGSRLVCDIMLDVIPDPLVEVQCALTMASFWPILATFQHEQLSGWGDFDFGGAYTLGILAGPGILSSVIVAFLGGAGELGDELEGECQKLADDHVRCAYRFAFGGNAVLPPLALADVVGYASGMALTGTAGPTPIIARGIKSLEQSPFRWEYTDLCHSQTQRATARVTVTCQDSIAPLLAQVTVRNDSLHVFTATTHVVGRTVMVDVPYLEKAAYAQAPYDCELLIQTSEGARVVKLGVVPEKAHDAVQWSILRARHCFRAVHQLWGRLYNPLWDVDPTPVDLPSRQLWQLDVGGVPADKVVVVLDHARSPIGWARPGGLGMAQLGALVDGAGSGSPIQIASSDATRGWRGSAPVPGGARNRRSAHPGSGAPAATSRTADGRAASADPVVHERQLNLRQSALARVGQLPLRAPVVDALLWQADGSTLLFVATAAGVSLYDLRIPAMPALVEDWPVDGVRGLSPIGRRVWAWGRGGVSVASPGQPLRRMGAARDLIALDSRRGVIFVLVGNRLLVCDEDLKPASSWPLPRSVGVAAVRGGVVAASRRGLVLFRVDGARIGRPVHEVRGVSASALVRLPNAVMQRAVFVRAAAGGGAVFDVTSLEQPVEVARYALDPWFYGLRRLGDLVVTYGSAEPRLDIYVEAGRALRRLGWSGDPPADADLDLPQDLPSPPA